MDHDSKQALVHKKKRGKEREQEKREKRRMRSPDESHDPKQFNTFETGAAAVRKKEKEEGRLHMHRFHFLKQDLMARLLNTISSSVKINKEVSSLNQSW